MREWFRTSGLSRGFSLPVAPFSFRVMLVASLVCGSIIRLPAQDSGPSEYQLKAAFIYNFANFVEWPDEALGKPDSPFVISVLGDNPFGEDLKKTVNAKSVKGHSFEVREVKSLSEATNCHILFICSSEKSRFKEILKAIPPTGILTVGDSDDFMEAGGMINLVTVEKRIRFQINDDMARKAGLKVSSKLLNLALHK